MQAESCAYPGDRSPARLRNKVFWLLGRASRRAGQRTQAALADEGLRRGFYGVLASLVEFGPSDQAEIGRRLGVDRSDMVAILTDLESEGLILRQTDESDRRRNVVTVTEDGRRALDRFDLAIERSQAELLEEFSVEDRQAILDLLSRLSGLAMAPAAGAASAEPARDPRDAR